MRGRCFTPTNKDYSNYGGRGITVCKEWDEFSNFRDWALSNGYADNLTLDRIDVNGNYEPSNCRWVTQKEQMRNVRCNVYATYKGETKLLIEWAEETGIGYNTLRSRYLRRGWSIEKSLTTPLLQKGGKHEPIKTN
jgi:hypothetical protein